MHKYNILGLIFMVVLHLILTGINEERKQEDTEPGSFATKRTSYSVNHGKKGKGHVAYILYQVR